MFEVITEDRPRGKMRLFIISEVAIFFSLFRHIHDLKLRVRGKVIGIHVLKLEGFTASCNFSHHLHLAPRLYIRLRF
jgi:hypothetical protein